MTARGGVRQSSMLLVIEAVLESVSSLVAQLSTRSFLESVSNLPIWGVLAVVVDVFESVSNLPIWGVLAESTAAVQIW